MPFKNGIPFNKIIPYHNVSSGVLSKKCTVFETCEPAIRCARACVCVGGLISVVHLHVSLFDYLQDTIREEQ